MRNERVMHMTHIGHMRAIVLVVMFIAPKSILIIPICYNGFSLRRV